MRRRNSKEKKGIPGNQTAERIRSFLLQIPLCLSLSQRQAVFLSSLSSSVFFTEVDRLQRLLKKIHLLLFCRLFSPLGHSKEVSLFLVSTSKLLSSSRVVAGTVHASAPIIATGRTPVDRHRFVECKTPLLLFFFFSFLLSSFLSCPRVALQSPVHLVAFLSRRLPYIAYPFFLLIRQSFGLGLHQRERKEEERAEIIPGRTSMRVP